MRKKLFLVGKIVLTVISLIGVIIFKSDIDCTNLSNISFDSAIAKEIVYDISIGIFSAMVLV